MKTKLVVGAILVLVIYVVFRWDYHVSNYLFSELCREEGRVGLYVYEKVPLGPEYVVPRPSGPESTRLSPRLFVDDKNMLDAEKLAAEYDFSAFLENQMVSEIGPISAAVTSVYRKSDGKLLGRSTGLVNQQGWLSQFTAMGKTPHIVCPGGMKDEDSRNFGWIHANLIREVFLLEP